MAFICYMDALNRRYLLINGHSLCLTKITR